MSFISQIFIDVLEQASDEMSNNSCNDFDVAVTAENCEQLYAFIIEYAQDDEDVLYSLISQFDKGRVYFQDWCVLNMLIKKMKAENA